MTTLEQELLQAAEIADRMAIVALSDKVRSERAAEAVRLRQRAAWVREHEAKLEFLSRIAARDGTVARRWYESLTGPIPEPAPPAEPGEPLCGKVGPHCVNGPCPGCGDTVTGEWFDGGEVTCDCGAILLAVLLEDGSWRFDICYVCSDPAHPKDCAKGWRHRRTTTRGSPPPNQRAPLYREPAEPKKGAR